MTSAPQGTAGSPSESPSAHESAGPAPAESYPSPTGLYARSETNRISQIEITAALLSVLWLLGCVSGFAILPDEDGSSVDTLRWVMVAMVVFFPVGMIWVAAMTLRAARILREDSLRLQTAIDAIRKSYISQSQRGVTEPSIARKLDEIAAATRKAEAALAVFTTSRVSPPTPHMPPVPPAAGAGPQGPTMQADQQPSLALGTVSGDLAPPLATPDFIRALNFPETAEDAEGFAALRQALKDRSTAQLVQASQDVLTLMSQDGIYMDDMRPDLARSEIWRAFAEGTRGRAIASLGGIRDRSALALISGRMKQDPIFRDAGHHFLRLFDRVFSDFAARATDAEIQAFATTRTAHAFMLLGRVAGTFN